LTTEDTESTEGEISKCFEKSSLEHI
jgi:hypothetical protein